MYSIFVQLLQENLMTPYEVSKNIGVSQSTLSDWKLGKGTPRDKTLKKIADFFGVSLEYLKGQTDIRNRRIEKSPDVESSRLVELYGLDPMPKMVKRPLLGAISCGDPIMSEENFEGYYNIPEMFISCDFILKCEGDSMTGARINDGDFVFIKQQTFVENGQIAAVLVDGTEKLLKRVYITDSSIVLQAENPAYPPKVFSKEDMNRVSIIGKAIGFASVLR